MPCIPVPAQRSASTHTRRRTTTLRARSAVRCKVCDGAAALHGALVSALDAALNRIYPIQRFHENRLKTQQTGIFGRAKGCCTVSVLESGSSSLISAKVSSEFQRKT
eukprot:6213823-Pleurochrysis_carterae.AAC.3